MISTNPHIQIITTTSKDFGYIVLHKSLLVELDGKPMIIHFSTEGLEITTYDKMMHNRTELYREDYTLERAFETEDIMNDPRFQEFNFIFNNCENFTNTFIDEHTQARRPHISAQTIFWFIVVAFVITKIINQ